MPENMYTIRQTYSGEAKSARHPYNKEAKHMLRCDGTSVFAGEAEHAAAFADKRRRYAFRALSGLRGKTGSAEETADPENDQ